VNERHEVCVVGAGPAGAVLAARLSELGHDVAIVEREPFPRPHIGESLSPAAWPLLDALGVADEVWAAGFRRTRHARVRWRAGEDERRRLDGGREGACGLTVDRGTFDAILLDRARAAGATVRTGTDARRPARTDDGWEIPVAGSVLRAGFVADATGRRRLLGGRRTPMSPRTLALHAIWRRRPSADDDAQTWIDAVAEGWLWGARLPDGGLRAMAFVDPPLLVAEGREHVRLYRRLLASSPLFAALTRSATIAGRVQACDATSYVAPGPIDARSVKVGEACFAIDPLSSCGVQTAMQSAMCAAAAVHSILLPDGDCAAALAFYAEYQRHAVRRHAATAARMYAEHRADGDAAFWHRRAAQAQPQAAAPVPAAPCLGGSLAELLPLRVRLRPGAELRATPCLVGDRIELRRALAHDGLERPVAFLASSELAPLLDGLPASASLADAIRSWDRRLPPGRGHEIARWLHARGLIERAP
jgi:flavin-dependent dehydrogenase